MKQLTTTVLSYHELDDLVHKTWPERNDFEVCCEEEWGNDQDHMFNVVEANDYDEDNFAKWLRKEKHSYIGAYQIMSALVTKGVLQPGNYTIEVSW